MPKNPARINDLLRLNIAAFLNKEMLTDEYLITVSQVICSADLNSAVIFISVYPADKESKALKTISRRLSDLSGFLLKNTVLRKVPKLRVKIDQGEKKAQEIDKILESLNLKTQKNNSLIILH